MTPRRETCRWIFNGYTGDWFIAIPVWSTECLEQFARSGEYMPDDCPHCGGRIVRDQPKEAS